MMREREVVSNADECRPLSLRLPRSIGSGGLKATARLRRSRYSRYRCTAWKVPTNVAIESDLRRVAIAIRRRSSVIGRKHNKNPATHTHTLARLLSIRSDSLAGSHPNERTFGSSRERGERHVAQLGSHRAIASGTIAAT